MSPFTAEETEVPRGGLGSPDHTESRRRSQDANSEPRSEPPAQSCLSSRCPSPPDTRRGCPCRPGDRHLAADALASLPPEGQPHKRVFASFPLMFQELEWSLDRASTTRLFVE